MDRLNIPIVRNEGDRQRFFVMVREVIEKWQGRKNPLDKVLTVRDLEKLGYDPQKVINATKQEPYLL